ncbi:MAG TPA: hypothetical protein VMT27_01540, partial [Actinomycetes bacterium]|nr:hypothetical protein [Actinomycetes bacterium]
TVDASVPTVSIKTSSGFGLTSSVLLKSTNALSGTNNNSLGVALKGGAKVSGSLSQVDSKTWKFTPDGRWIPGAAYVPFVAPSVTSNSSGIVAVGDNGARRPSGLVDSKSGAMKKIDGDFNWSTRSASDAIGKSYVATKHQASSNNRPAVTVKFGGTSVSLVACRSSANGFADIYIDGTKVKSVDLYKSVSSCRNVWSKSGLTDDVHTLKILVTGKKNSDSSGTYVGIDAVKAG